MCRTIKKPMAKVTIFRTGKLKKRPNFNKELKMADMESEVLVTIRE